MQQNSFDNYAAEYDSHFTNSLIGKAQRKVVHNYLAHIANKNHSVLELNCGTGEDAIIISSLFDQVLCTDISSEMIKICKEKTLHLKNCKTMNLSIQEIDKNVNDRFDLIFSNFGGLNCLSDKELKSFSDSCFHLSKNEGNLVFVIMGRKCLWEKFFFRMRKEIEKSKRRSLPNGVETNIKGSVFNTYYYSPNEIQELFKKHYTLKKIRPVGFFVPPSYLEPLMLKHRFLFSLFVMLDKLTSRIPFLSDYADHYIIHLKKI
jgi:ubiquinone/menaquinone biosynthesis C-methylase UbiE